MDNHFRVYFFFGIFASSLLVQIVDAIPSTNGKRRNTLHQQEHQIEDQKHQEGPSERSNLEYLREKDQKYYYSVIVPLANKCADQEFTAQAKKGKLNLCSIVKDLKAKFEDGSDQPIAIDEATYEEEPPTEDPDTIVSYMQNIYRVIKTSVNRFYEQYNNVLGRSGDRTIGIMRNARDIIWTDGEQVAFQKTFDQLIEASNDGKNANKHSINESHQKGVKTTNETAPELAFKLVYIGIEMHYKFIRANDGKKLDWALQQFAASLAIHSLDFDEYDKEVIQEIAKIGMQIAEEGKEKEAIQKEENIGKKGKMDEEDSLVEEEAVRK